MFVDFGCLGFSCSVLCFCGRVLGAVVAYDLVFVCVVCRFRACVGVCRFMPVVLGIYLVWFNSVVALLVLVY